MLAREGGVVPAPHLPADEDRLLEALEPLRDRREQQAEAGRLLGVPGGADAEDRAPARQHVERGHRLGEQAGLTVDDRGDHGEQLDPLGLRRQPAERGVGLEHLVLGRADVADLPEVVHDADPVEAAVFRVPGDVGELEASFIFQPYPGALMDRLRLGTHLRRDYLGAQGEGSGWARGEGSRMGAGRGVTDD